VKPSSASAKLRVVGLAFVVLGAAAIGLTWISKEVSPLPAFDTVNARTLPLAGPIYVHRGHNGRGPVWAEVPLVNQTASIEDICDLWHCEIPSRLAALDRGDTVTVWISAMRVWQLARRDTILLTFADAKRAARTSAVRMTVSYAVVAGVGFVLLAWAGVQRRRS
jgi:hypothetical protein